MEVKYILNTYIGIYITYKAFWYYKASAHLIMQIINIIQDIEDEQNVKRLIIVIK